MASAFGRSPELQLEEPACFAGSPSHIGDVRRTERGRAEQGDKKSGMGSITGARRPASDGRQQIWGGDQIDPRLFYFRALLESDRFFGGGNVPERA
jgi:hypothetical protein